MLYIIRFIFGYLYVRFSGDIAETVFNICARNGISLWDSKCVKKRINVFLSVGDFKRLRPALRGSGIRVHILKKYGLPFFLKKYNKRLGLLAGAAFFVAFLKLMSCFIWTVEVKGNSFVESEKILAACREIGVYEGAPVKSIKPQIQKQQLMLRVDGLAWASLNIEGCKLCVNVTEVRPKAEDNSVPTNLKASADGTIKKVDITSGNCVVKVGETVNKGDLLVSGVIERQDSTSFVHSIGTVTAVTEREIKVSGKYKAIDKVKTGRIKKKKVLSLFGIKIPLYLGSETGEFEKKTYKKALKLFGEELPVRLHTAEFIFTEEKEVSLNKNQLEKKLDNMLLQQIKKEKIVNYKMTGHDFTETGDGLTLTARISAEEDIAIQEILIISSGN